MMTCLSDVVILLCLAVSLLHHFLLEVTDHKLYKLYHNSTSSTVRFSPQACNVKCRVKTALCHAKVFLRNQAEHGPERPWKGGAAQVLSLGPAANQKRTLLTLLTATGALHSRGFHTWPWSDAVRQRGGLWLVTASSQDGRGKAGLKMACENAR